VAAEFLLYTFNEKAKQTHGFFALFCVKGAKPYPAKRFSFARRENLIFVFLSSYTYKSHIVHFSIF